MTATVLKFPFSRRDGPSLPRASGQVVVRFQPRWLAPPEPLAEDGRTVTDARLKRFDGMSLAVDFWLAYWRRLGIIR